MLWESLKKEIPSSKNRVWHQLVGSYNGEVPWIVRQSICPRPFMRHPGGLFLWAMCMSASRNAFVHMETTALNRRVQGLIRTAAFWGT